MNKYYVLYNPLAGNGNCKESVKELDNILSGHEIEYCDMTKIDSYKDFFAEIERSAEILVSGGDGTLNRFINSTLDIELDRNIYYYAAGSGNDFLHDLGADKDGKKEIVCLNKYISKLPVVTVNGKKYKFLNGIGYGIDGYCCEEGDRQRAAGKKNVNYTSIAIKGLLSKYKRVNATVTVDGVTKSFKKVWMAPTMNGRFYGGGMMATPKQDRLNEEGTVTALVMHGSNKLKTLMIFPSIFQGRHIEHEEMTYMVSGYNISVQFDRPTALQIDGETILGVTEYSVNASEEARLGQELSKLA